jgi:3',5'-cyclic AMP phosphodiesterase CpdA
METRIVTRPRLLACLLACQSVLLCTLSVGCRRATANVDPPYVASLISRSGPTFTVPASALPDHWSVIAYGDTRFTDPADRDDTNPEARRTLVARIAEQHPDALVISGDLPLNGSVAEDYAVYQQETAAWRAAGLRVYPAIGNHELKGGQDLDPGNWWATFPDLNRRRWYSVAFGNSYIITLDSDLPLVQGTRQQRWLKNQLDHLPANTQYVFVSLHHPPVADSLWYDHSHDVRPNEQALATFLEKRQATSHAAFIVIAGHIHNYQRFMHNGVFYLVSGGGGAKPHMVSRTAADLYQDSSFPNYHYIRFDFDGQTLHAVMHRLADPEASQPVWQDKDSFDVPLRH